MGIGQRRFVRRARVCVAAHMRERREREVRARVRAGVVGLWAGHAGLLGRLVQLDQGVGVLSFSFLFFFFFSISFLFI